MVSECRYQTLTVTTPVNSTTLEKLRANFAKVYFYPEGDIPQEALLETEVFFTPWEGVPDWVMPGMIPNTRLIQLTSGTYPDTSIWPSSGSRRDPTLTFQLALIEHFYRPVCVRLLQVTISVYDSALPRVSYQSLRPRLTVRYTQLQHIAVYRRSDCQL